MLTVEKIGGSSMSQFKVVMDNILLGNRNPSEIYNRIFVVSAYNNVTNWLLEHKKTGEPGIFVTFLENGDYGVALDSLCQRLLLINKTLEDLGLDLQEAKEFLTFRIEQAKRMLFSLSRVLASGYVNPDDIYLAAREILASIGEAHSAWNTANILMNNGVSVRFVDLCGFDDMQPLTIDQRIKKALDKIDFSKVLCICTGYTKGTEGIMRAFDRGYSEITFSKIAVEVKASEAIIHKEFHLSSADPNIVGIDKVKPVGHTNFIIADQLADIGMEAIHPKASKPLELENINIRIKNTFEPNHPGTLISKDYISKEHKVEIVSGSDKVLAIEIHDPMMVGEVGFDLRIMTIFQKHGVSYILKSTNANSITMVVWDNYQARILVEELRDAFYQIIVERSALVCVMGTNIAVPGFLYRASKALFDAEINVESMGQSLRQVNMQFVIERNKYKTAISVLNEALCLS